MKHKIQLLLSSLLMLSIIALSSGCASKLADRQNPSHMHRNVWVNNVYYEQVYYVQDGKAVVIAQRPVPGDNNLPGLNTGTQTNGYKD